MRRFLLRLLRFGRPTTAERHRKALENGAREGVRLMAQEFSRPRHPDFPWKEG